MLCSMAYFFALATASFCSVLNLIKGAARAPKIPSLEPGPENPS